MLHVVLCWIGLEYPPVWKKPHWLNSCGPSSAPTDLKLRVCHAPRLASLSATCPHAIGRVLNSSHEIPRCLGGRVRGSKERKENAPTVRVNREEEEEKKRKLLCRQLACHHGPELDTSASWARPPQLFAQGENAVNYYGPCFGNNQLWN